MTEPVDGRQLMRDLQPRQARASAALETALGIEEQTLLPSLTEYTNYIRSSKRIEIYGPTPEFRSIESDQTDPAGQFRWQGSAGSYTLTKALTALWATSEIILQHDVTNKVTYLKAITAADWRVILEGGTITDNGGDIQIGPGSLAGTTGLTFRTGNGAGAATARMTFGSDAATPDIDLAACALDMNGLILKGLATMAGQGTGNVNFKAYKLTTDATAYRIGLYVLNPATDTEYTVANAVPDADVPKFTMAAPDDAPSTSELDDGHVTFGYTKSTNTLTVYMNEGGAIVSLALGVLA